MKMYKRQLEQITD